MHSDDHTPKHTQTDAATTAFTQALANSLDRACAQLPTSTQAALAASRARVLGQPKRHWHWAIAASLLLALGMLNWHAPPQDTDAMALEMLQTDDQLLNEIDLLETLAEVDET